MVNHSPKMLTSKEKATITQQPQQSYEKLVLSLLLSESGVTSLFMCPKGLPLRSCVINRHCNPWRWKPAFKNKSKIPAAHFPHMFVFLKQISVLKKCFLWSHLLKVLMGLHHVISVVLFGFVWQGDCVVLLCLTGRLCCVVLLCLTGKLCCAVFFVWQGDCVVLFCFVWQGDCVPLCCFALFDREAVLFCFALFHREMLDQSAAELKATIDELEKRFDSIENEGRHFYCFSLGMSWKAYWFIYSLISRAWTFFYSMKKQFLASLYWYISPLHFFFNLFLYILHHCCLCFMKWKKKMHDFLFIF